MNDYEYAHNVLNSPKVELSKKNQFERKITKIRIDRIKENPIKGNFDFEHLAKIHYAIFKDLYDHAGKLRDETDYWAKSFNDKETTIFAHASQAKKIIDDVAYNIKNKNYLIGYDKESFVKEFTEAFAQVNHAHPFVDGNGRSTRVLFSQLADNAGFDFDVSNIDKDEWDYANLKSGVHEKLRFFGLFEETYQPDTRLLHKLMKIAISEKK